MPDSVTDIQRRFRESCSKGSFPEAYYEARWLGRLLGPGFAEDRRLAEALNHYLTIPFHIHHRQIRSLARKLDTLRTNGNALWTGPLRQVGEQFAEPLNLLAQLLTAHKNRNATEFEPVYRRLDALGWSGEIRSLRRDLTRLVLVEKIAAAFNRYGSTAERQGRLAVLSSSLLSPEADADGILAELQRHHGLGSPESERFRQAWRMGDAETCMQIIADLQCVEDASACAVLHELEEHIARARQADREMEQEIANAEYGCVNNAEQTAQAEFRMNVDLREIRWHLTHCQRLTRKMTSQLDAADFDGAMAAIADIRRMRTAALLLMPDDDAKSRFPPRGEARKAEFQRARQRLESYQQLADAIENRINAHQREFEDSMLETRATCQKSRFDEALGWATMCLGLFPEVSFMRYVVHELGQCLFLLQQFEQDDALGDNERQQLAAKRQFKRALAAAEMARTRWRTFLIEWQELRLPHISRHICSAVNPYWPKRRAELQRRFKQQVREARIAYWAAFGTGQLLLGWLRDKLNQQRDTG